MKKNKLLLLSGQQQNAVNVYKREWNSIKLRKLITEDVLCLKEEDILEKIARRSKENTVASIKNKSCWDQLVLVEKKKGSWNGKGFIFSQLKVSWRSYVCYGVGINFPCVDWKPNFFQFGRRIGLENSFGLKIVWYFFDMCTNVLSVKSITANVGAATFTREDIIAENVKTICGGENATVGCVQ